MMRGIWNRETVALILLAAAIPVAVAWLWAEGAAGATRLLFAIVVGGVWQAAFTVLRAQAPSAAGAVSALVIAMLAPEVGPFQFILGISFGFVFGELVYGGWGRSVLSPAVIAIMFLGFGFPTAAWQPLAIPVGWATIPAAMLLLALGILPWRVLVSALVVLVIGGGFGLDLLTSAAALVLIFLVCDPATCASTSLGRWLNGALFGALTVLFSGTWATTPVQIAVSAALLTALAVPLLDEIAIAIWRALRRHRHG